MKKRYIAWVTAFCLAGALAGAQPLAVQAEEIDTQEAETDEADEETDELAAGNGTIFTLLDEPLSVQTYEGGGSLIEVYGGFTQVTGSDASETVLEDSRLILKRGSLIAVPSDLDYLDSRIDQIVVDTVSSSDTEVQYLSVLTEDHCVVDYYEALNWPEELSNAGIAEISNTLDTGDTVLIVRYLDNTVAAFNYLTGNLIYIDESEKTQLGFFEYLSNWFSETWNSLFGTQEEVYAELAQLEEELEETPVDSELLASLLGSDTADSDGAGAASGQTGVTYGETAASGDGTAVSGDATAAGETAEVSDGVTAVGETAEVSDGVTAAGETAEASDGAAATEETAVASGETAVSEETAADPDDSMTEDGTAVSDGTAASEDGTAVPDETDVTADDSAEAVDDADTEEEIVVADDAEGSAENTASSKEQGDAAVSDETAESEEDTETSAETETEGGAAASDDTMSGGSGASGSSGGGDAIAAAASGASGSSGADTAESASSEDESAAAEAETARAEVDGYIKVYDPETETYALYTTEEYLSQSTAGGELLSETEKLEYLEAGGYAADTVNIAMSVEKKSGLRYVVLVCAGVIILLGVLFVVRLKLEGQTPKEKKTRNQQ